MKILKNYYLFILTSILCGCGPKDSSSNFSNNISSSSIENSYNQVRLPEEVYQITGVINIWVEMGKGEFYQSILNDYKKEFGLNCDFYVKEKNISYHDENSIIKDFDGDFDDADITVLPSERITRLMSYDSYISPITNQELIDQISNNIEYVKESVKREKNNEIAFYGAPYTFETNVLYYNKLAVSDEQAKTFEGLAEAAKNVSTLNNKVKACTFLESNMQNFSWSILSKKLPENTSTLKLYEDYKVDNCYFQGDDMIAVTKWAQDYFNLENGAKFASSMGWEFELAPKTNSNVGDVISMIGNINDFDKVKSILGKNNVGVAKLPTFTTKEKFGSIAEGTIFQAGTFTNVKAFVINNVSRFEQKKYYDILLPYVVKYLSSNEVQLEAYKSCDILPISLDVELNYNEDALCSAQREMLEYGTLHTMDTHPYQVDIKAQNYYDKGAEDLYKELIENKNNLFSTYDNIKQQHSTIEKIFRTGKK